MKQTAVEWFFKKLNENQDKTYKQIELIFNQAKEMEKEQMIKFDTLYDFVDQKMVEGDDKAEILLNNNK